MAPLGPINPLDREPVSESLDVGIRAVNALLTVGNGQRLGLFAGTGVGKSVLLGMMARFTEADVVVVGLIGERGREVREFVEDNLGVGLGKSVVVAAPADDPAVKRLRAARYATRLAERFRVAGKRVLLLLDSLTRVAQAQREVGLAAGEPPTVKGYPPSVFAVLPELVERAGRVQGAGSVTGVYTVLVEEDDLTDPIADAARGILDGHIVLDRTLAERGVFPAIDVQRSLSRVMPNVVDAEHLEHARAFRRLWSVYAEQRDLVTIGAYTSGTDPELDRAIAARPQLESFVTQTDAVGVPFDQSVSELARTLAETNAVNVVAP